MSHRRGPGQSGGRKSGTPVHRDARVARPGATEDEVLMAKIVALLRTLPPPRKRGAGRGLDSSGGPVVCAPLPPATVHRLVTAGRNEAACICSNLVAVSRAFADLPDDELLAVPESLRDEARGELIGVWKVLDLLRRMEIVQGGQVAGS